MPAGSGSGTRLKASHTPHVWSSEWIEFCNHRRPHQALGMKPPAEADALAA